MAEDGAWREASGVKGQVVEAGVKDLMGSRRACKGWHLLSMGSQWRVLNEVSDIV